MNALGRLQPRKRSYRFPSFVLGNAQLVQTLQVEPKPRARAEEVTEAQGGVACDGAVPVQNASDTVRRDIQFARQLGSAHSELS